MSTTPQEPAVSKAAKRVAANLRKSDTQPIPKVVRRSSKQARAVEAARRSRRASTLRAKLLAFKHAHHLTWDEVAYVMKMSDARVVLSVITLKRFALAYVIPFQTTLDSVGRFIDVVDRMRTREPRPKAKDREGPPSDVPEVVEAAPVDESVEAREEESDDEV
jgi:hypothetical protein